ncbi:MAG TPA: hypothetical protein VFS08_02305 [Gemmatimonadaceae bacterium]|nr:hypothetical protein [Gemmatimonadaceae bacterium]
MTRPKSVALAFLTGAVLVGGLLGFTADRLVGERLCERQGDQRRTREQLAADLGLDPAQRVVFDSLLDARVRRLRALYATVRPQADSLYNDSHDQIRRILTPEQRARYEELVKRANARMEKR